MGAFAGAGKWRAKSGPYFDEGRMLYSVYLGALVDPERWATLIAGPSCPFCVNLLRKCRSEEVIVIRGSAGSGFSNGLPVRERSG